MNSRSKEIIEEAISQGKWTWLEIDNNSNSLYLEFENLKIEETTTMARTDEAKEIVVQIEYSSNNGDGVYGFLYNLDDYSNPELLQQGADITIDNLLK